MKVPHPGRELPWLQDQLEGLQLSGPRLQGVWGEEWAGRQHVERRMLPCEAGWQPRLPPELRVFPGLKPRTQGVVFPQAPVVAGVWYVGCGVGMQTGSRRLTGCGVTGWKRCVC